MADFKIQISRLENCATQLEAIVNDFDNATSLSEALEAAIGKPFGKDELKDKAEEFESRWDDKRDQLKDSLQKVQEHVAGVVEAVKDWDNQTAIQLTSP